MALYTAVALDERVNIFATVLTIAHAPSVDALQDAIVENIATEIMGDYNNPETDLDPATTWGEFYDDNTGSPTITVSYYLNEEFVGSLTEDVIPKAIQRILSVVACQ